MLTNEFDLTTGNADHDSQSQGARVPQVEARLLTPLPGSSITAS